MKYNGPLMARELIVIGNWKMHKTMREATAFLETLFPLLKKCKAKIFLAVPYTSIAPASKLAKEEGIFIGAQNMHDAREGAFTGEIAALMLKEAGAEFVLLGHSERRHVFGETNEFIQKKVVRALQDDLIPVVCVGETAAEREEEKTEEILEQQICACLDSVPKEEAGKLVLAYEPVWAIGTGKTASAAMANEAHAVCRKTLTKLFGKRIAAKIPILYGGSVKADNAASLAAEPEIDGLLVGGASLEPKTFAKIATTLKKGAS
jgi:triosephosphate isomerase (TIM)